MAFVNFSLIFGGLFVSIPVVLHLVMRQQPKQLVFPAIRFLQARQETNRRQLQLRQWLLLLLRCLLIGMLAAALMRPSVPAPVQGNWMTIGILAALLLLSTLLAVVALVQRRGRLLVGGLWSLTGLLALVLAVVTWSACWQTDQASLGQRETPVGAVLVFDSSPRMQYVWQNQTRLQEACEMALQLAQQLPAESDLAVVDARPGAPRAFAVDLVAAKRAIERLDVTATPRPLNELLVEAIELAAASPRSRKEIYIFTDLTRAAWKPEPDGALRRRVTEARQVTLYVIDVGCDQPQNFALGDVRLSAQGLPRSGELQIATELTCQGVAGTRTVELYLEQPDRQRPYLQDGKPLLPETKLRGQEVVTLPDRGSQALEFRVSHLDLGVQQGFLKIAGQDGLAVDDVRYFTVEVQEAVPLLVLAPAGVATKYFVEAVAPYEFRETGRARYACTVVSQPELQNQHLSDYAAVCLLDPTPLTPPEWEKLGGYVGNGGGLAVFLGHNAASGPFSVPAALPLLGGRPTRQWRSSGDLFLAPRNFSHPVTAAFREFAARVPWNRFPVYRHWVFEGFTPGAHALVPYSNWQPALIETALGRGRTLVLTTPISDPARPRGRETWNELPTGSDAWPFVVLVNEMVRYLADAGGLKLNYLAGETAVLANRPVQDPERYQLFTPSEQPQDVTAAGGKLVVKFTECPGAYRLKGHRGRPIVRGFCVNLPRVATELTRLTRADLDGVLGPDRYHLARTLDELTSGVGEARLGREFYPLLISLWAVLFALEHLLANRFYRGRSQPAEANAA